MKLEPANLILAAWGISLVATLGSLSYSGVGFLGINGLGLPPCEMCWYQRILMYPLTAILAIAYLRQDHTATRLALGFAVPGALLAGYHSLIQLRPELEGGQCVVGACSVVMYRVAGLSIPNQALIAFLAIGALLAIALAQARRMAQQGPAAGGNVSGTPDVGESG